MCFKKILDKSKYILTVSSCINTLVLYSVALIPIETLFPDLQIFVLWQYKYCYNITDSQILFIC